MAVDARVKWGIAGLLAFEAIIVYVTWGGSPFFTAMYLVGAVLLGWLLVRAAQGENPTFPVLLVIALAALVRAILQTRNPAFPIGVLPTYLVPVGFAMMALAARSLSANARVALVGIVLVALARSWFVVWYFQRGATLVAFANLLGAAGAWAWASGVPKSAVAGAKAAGA